MWNHDWRFNWLLHLNATVNHLSLKFDASVCAHVSLQELTRDIAIFFIFFLDDKMMSWRKNGAGETLFMHRYTFSASIFAHLSFSSAVILQYIMLYFHLLFCILYISASASRCLSVSLHLKGKGIYPCLPIKPPPLYLFYLVWFDGFRAKSLPFTYLLWKSDPLVFMLSQHRDTVNVELACTVGGQ